MMAITHATIAAAGTSLILGTADPLTLLLSLIGSQIPDLDTSSSVVGQIFFPISTYIEKHFPHRSITHCLIFTIVLAILSISAGLFTGHLIPAIALPLGHFLSCFSDMFTKQGVMLFYPYPAWCISVSNPKKRLVTGGTTEYWVLAISVGLLALGLHFGSNGGMTQQLTSALGMTDSVVETYNQKSATHHVWADIKGIWASDRTRADDRYFIVANEGDSFIVTDGKGGFFKTGQQILTERIAATIGNPATTQLQTISFMDEEIAPKLQEVAASQPNALILLSGSIVIDLPENVRIPIEANRLQTAKLVDKTVTMTVHPIEAALQQLGEQYATGTLTVKVISPRAM